MIAIGFIISLIVLFLHSTSWEGMIFEGVKKLIKPEGMLYKPIYGCPICMTPWWGSLIYYLFFAMYGWMVWIICIGVASGFSVLYVCLITIRDYFVEATKKL